MVVRTYAFLIYFLHHKDNIKNPILQTFMIVFNRIFLFSYKITLTVYCGHIIFAKKFCI